MNNKVTLNRLRKYNFLMGLFHLAQGLIIILLSNTFSLPVRNSFLHYMSDTGSLQAITEDIVSLRIGPLVAGFLFISAIAHFTVSSPWFFTRYARDLNHGINYFRWYEYTLSASLMVVIIAMLCGIYDIVALIALFGLTAVMNLFGLMMEVHNQTTQKTDWTAFYLGSIAGILPWVGIAIYFLGSADSGHMPTFVYFITLSLFLLFCTFPVNMVLQYKKVGPWNNYLYGEAVYIFLSLTAKSVLAWQVFGGTLARSGN